ncbi:unnamed protein product [Adineta steineri]|uniref:Uncharacterized protein n=1 Tax=Adineta steineri TaxID=433720 RepID=A0A815BRZ9_9BILA|nr:unnamed protein product [Adineta steineri]CAF3890539.1 unnamed protein product [Adineta steineri]
MADKKKKKGGGGKKKKKAGENVYEALLEYKITVIDKELEEWRFRVYKIEEENEALLGRDAHLRDECAASMKHLVTNALQFDKENITYPKVDREEVHAAVHEKMNAAAEQEAELRKIHDEMFHVEIEIFKVRSQIKQLTKYRDVTQIEEQRAIQSLEQELAYMIDNYDVLSKYLEESKNDEQTALTQMAQNKINQKTRTATERVALGLDQFTKKMLSENQYMTHEISLQERRASELEEQVRALEQTNVIISEKLAAAHVADTTTFKNTFVTDLFTDDISTDIGNNCILAVDLGQLTIRSDTGDKTFEELLNELDKNTPRLSTIDDNSTLASPSANLHVEGTHMQVRSPPKLDEEEEKYLDFRGHTWIDPPRLKQALRKS